MTGAERDGIYAEQARRYPGFAEYERQTAGMRTIPVLEPRPHRLAVSAEQARAQLRVEVRALRLDGEAVDAVPSAPGGLSVITIARALVVSTRTVHHHVEHIYDKLGVSTRAAATLFAMQHERLDH